MHFISRSGNAAGECRKPSQATVGTTKISLPKEEGPSFVKVPPQFPSREKTKSRRSGRYHKGAPAQMAHQSNQIKNPDPIHAMKRVKNIKDKEHQVI